MITVNLFFAASGQAFVTGYTYSITFSGVDPYQSSRNNGYDAYLSKLELTCYLTTPTPSVTSTPSVTPTASVTPTPTPSVPPTPPPTVPPTPSVPPMTTTPTIAPTATPTSFPSTPTPATTTTPPPFPTPVYLVMASGDYTGDGTSDIAVFRQDNGL